MKRLVYGLLLFSFTIMMVVAGSNLLNPPTAVAADEAIGVPQPQGRIAPFYGVSPATESTPITLGVPEGLPTTTPRNTPSQPTSTNTPITPSATPDDPTPTATPTSNRTQDINVTPGAFVETHTNAPQVTTDTMNIANTVILTSLNWTIVEDNGRPWSNPNPITPRDPNASTHRLGTATGSGTHKVDVGPIVGDGSFEAGTPNPAWQEYSVNFGTPLCDSACGTGGGTGPRTGAWWAWFGGTTAAETGIITQTVTIPAGRAELSFWLEIPATARPGLFRVLIDNMQIFSVTNTDTGYETYNEVVIDLAAYADGESHELEFSGITDPGVGVTSFFVDDIAITPQSGGLCAVPSEISWLTVSPTNGNIFGQGSTPVTLTYNSASLVQGTYTATLCINSNDPDEALIRVPVTLLVEQPPTAIDLNTFDILLPDVPVADLAVAGVLLLAGTLVVLRRK